MMNRINGVLLVLCMVVSILWNAASAHAQITPDRFEPNNSLAEASIIGVAPGTTLDALTIHEAGDVDWYRVELLRPDSIVVKIGFASDDGVLLFDVCDAEGATIASGSPSDNGAGVTINSLTPGAYYVRISGTEGSVNAYSLAVEPAPASSTRVIYVNNHLLDNLYYTTAAGDNANTGLTPGDPKTSLQSVLADYTLGPNDLVLIDTGNYDAGLITITVDDEGAAYAGSPAGSNFTRNGTRFEILGASSNLFYGLSFTVSAGGTGFDVKASGASTPSGNIFRANKFSATSVAIQIKAGVDNVIENNEISGGGSYGIYLIGGSSATVSGNVITGRTDGIRCTGGASISGNEISSATRGIYVSTGTAEVFDNNISNCSTGIQADTVATIYANTLTGNAKGIYSSSTSSSVYGNTISGGTTGIEARGTIGGSSWTDGQPNDISNNSGAGIIALSNAVVRFNRIHRNATGVSLSSAPSVNIHHNLIYRSTAQAVSVSGSSNVEIVNNTIYTPAGDGVTLMNSSSNVTLRNNIIWTQAGCCIRTASDSQSGFTSDYNNLFTSGTGSIAYWQKDFTDLLDWRIETGSDVNSIGYTVVNPELDNPHFFNIEADDYRVNLNSTGIDAGRPGDGFSLEPEPNGGRVNLGAFGNTTLAGTSSAACITVLHPNYYLDWPATYGKVINWRSRNVTGSVRIELHREDIGHVLNIATVSVEDEYLNWIPANNGITGNVDYRYRIRIVSVASPGIIGESREAFAVPPVSDTYYINDSSANNDQYTTAPGDNRNTGTTPNDPKPDLLSFCEIAGPFAR